MGKNLLVAQSGGPSAAINATLAGVIAAAQKQPDIGRIYGGLHGIAGIMDRNLVDLTDFDRWEELKSTPAMALGSCRCKLPPAENQTAPEYQKLRQIFLDFEIGYFLYIGGNDSMDTVLKLSRFFDGEPEAPVFIGLPKTIDNDLPETDHTPGYGSAAKYLAITMGEIIRDTAIYNVPAVTIVEIMGRNAGWLTLAAGLPRFTGGSKPDLIYLPENVFDETEFMERIQECCMKTPNVVVAVSEGLRDADGKYVGTAAKSGTEDAFGHDYLSGVGKYLECLVRQKTGLKVRSVELNILQRCASHLGSLMDIEESFSVGRAGVEAVLRGETGRMVAIERVCNKPYAIRFVTTEIEKAANLERLVPEKWRNIEDPEAVREIREYILPLIQGDVHQFRNPFGMNEYISFLN